MCPSTADVIPQDKRCPFFKEFVFGLCKELSQLIRRDEEFRREPHPVLSGLAPWIFTSELGPDFAREMQRRKERYVANGFDGSRFASQLDSILESDLHLKECCLFDVSLVNYIDLYLGQMLTISFIGPRSDQADRLWEEFERLTYETGRFAQLAYTHLFNFETEDTFEHGGFEVVRLELPQIATILGEPSAKPFLHSPDTGQYFMVRKDRKRSDDWLVRQRIGALELVRAIQYFKDGLMHATYTVPHYEPSWVNSLEKSGLFFLGNPRQQPYRRGTARYRLAKPEVDNLKEWLSVYFSDRVQLKMKDENNGFRQMLLRAGAYYESSLIREAGPERLVDLAIALESMFTPGSARTELTLRIAQSVAQLVGKTAEERLNIFKSTKKLYDRRSSLLHGQYDVIEYARGEFVTDDENESWASIIRKALVRSTVLYLRQDIDKEKFLVELNEAALDNLAAERIRAQSDPQLFMQHWMSHSDVIS